MNIHFFMLCFSCGIQVNLVKGTAGSEVYCCYGYPHAPQASNSCSHTSHVSSPASPTSAMALVPGSISAPGVAISFLFLLPRCDGISPVP